MDQTTNINKSVLEIVWLSLLPFPDPRSFRGYEHRRVIAAYYVLE